MTLCTIENPWSQSLRVGQSGAFCYNIAIIIIVQRVMKIDRHSFRSSKSKMLSQCWVNVRPASLSLGQHKSNIGLKFCRKQY